ncbi:MAG: NTP transferase domain-containing protein [Candidatus Marinimicrobia bacterium]|nr:NTP transferase domain-containing protein [Candidatus Neomarinimicrobiota bacterium]
MSDSPQLAAVIMAAGIGKRMEDDRPKVLHEYAGRPMIAAVVETALAVGADPVIVVVGHKADEVKAAVAGQHVEFAHQAEQQGTAHAVLQAAPLLEQFTGDVVVLSGDVPALTTGTLKGLIRRHRETGAAATVLAAELPDASGYGRVILDDHQLLLKVVEEKDATPEERLVKLINSGIYLFKAQHLLSSLLMVGNQNKQSEYYLPDTLYILKEQNLPVAVEKITGFREILGVNTKAELEKLNEELTD